MNATKIWRIIDLINWGTEHFLNKKITNARKEIEWFLCDVLQCVLEFVYCSVLSTNDSL